MNFKEFFIRHNRVLFITLLIICGLLLLASCCVATGLFMTVPLAFSSLTFLLVFLLVFFKKVNGFFLFLSALLAKLTLFISIPTTGAIVTSPKVAALGYLITGLIFVLVMTLFEGMVIWLMTRKKYKEKTTFFKSFFCALLANALLSMLVFLLLQDRFNFCKIIHNIFK